MYSDYMKTRNTLKKDYSKDTKPDNPKFEPMRYTNI